MSVFHCFCPLCAGRGKRGKAITGRKRNINELLQSDDSEDEAFKTPAPPRPRATRKKNALTFSSDEDDDELANWEATPTAPSK